MLIIKDDSKELQDIRNGYRTLENMGFLKHAPLKTFEVRLWLNEYDYFTYEFKKLTSAKRCLKNAKGHYVDGSINKLVNGRIVFYNEPVYMSDL